MVQLIRAALVVAAILLPASAWALTDPVDYTDPRAVVAAAYEPYLEPDFDWDDYDPSALRSRALNALYQRDARDAAAAGGSGRLRIDPLVHGRDYDIRDLLIGEAEIAGRRARVPVHFTNRGTPMAITIHLVEEDYGWSIDEVVSDSGEIAYSLREILNAPYPD